MNLFGMEIPGFDGLMQMVGLFRGIKSLESFEAKEMADADGTSAQVMDASADASILGDGGTAVV